MKTKISILFVLAIFNTSLMAQLSSVSFSGGWTGAINNRSDKKVNSVYGYGGNLEIAFNAGKNITLGISGGYKALSIDQENLALFQEWNWRYWKRYFGDINDPNFYRSTQWVQSILKDSNYSATFHPVQKMDIFPVTLTVNYDLEIDDSFSLMPSLGAGMIFYSRHLYVEETWSKKFLQMNNYTYSYSFHDMAESINGNPLTAVLGLQGSYKLGDLIKINAGLKYYRIIPTEGRMGYDNYPLKDMLSTHLAVTFNY